jgi:hypothetical protein
LGEVESNAGEESGIVRPAVSEQKEKKAVFGSGPVSE